MTKQQAIEELKKWKKLTHTYFASYEWMTLSGLMLHFEDGVKISLDEFFHNRKGAGWQYGYSIFKETTTEPDQTKLPSEPAEQSNEP